MLNIDLQRFDSASPSVPNGDEFRFVQSCVSELREFLHECPEQWLDLCATVKETVVYAGVAIVESITKEKMRWCDHQWVSVREIAKACSDDDFVDIISERDIGDVRVTPFTFILIAGSRHGWRMNSCKRMSSIQPDVFDLLHWLLWDCRDIGKEILDE